MSADGRKLKTTHWLMSHKQNTQRCCCLWLKSVGNRRLLQRKWQLECFPSAGQIRPRSKTSFKKVFLTRARSVLQIDQLLCNNPVKYQFSKMYDNLCYWKWSERLHLNHAFDLSLQINNTILLMGAMQKNVIICWVYNSWI